MLFKLKTGDFVNPKTIRRVKAHYETPNWFVKVTTDIDTIEVDVNSREEAMKLVDNLTRMANAD